MLDISIGTMSSMHPVDWLAVNRQAGVEVPALVSRHASRTTTDTQAILAQQPKAWQADTGRDDEWFDAGNTSILRTPRGRDDDLVFDDDAVVDGHSNNNNNTRSVRHEVETVLTFPLHDALNLGALLDLLHRLHATEGGGGGPGSASRAHATTPGDERTTPQPGADDDMMMMIPPFSSIKRGSAGGKQLAALAASQAACWGGESADPRGGATAMRGSDDALGESERPRPLVRSKRSLFDVRVSLDDSSDDGVDDDGVDDDCLHKSRDGDDVARDNAENISLFHN